MYKKNNTSFCPTENMWRAHPWHGIPIGDNAPAEVTAFIEIVPSDTMKFELDKLTGFLKVDRPQKFSNICPTLYGFIPQTFCGHRIAQHAGIHKGDGDPLDICVLSERTISHGDFIVKVVPIGGFCLIDNGEADDKIIAFVAQDDFYKGWTDIRDVPSSVISRLEHYFLTYKTRPGAEAQCYIKRTYGRTEAHEVIKLSTLDYNDYKSPNTAPTHTPVHYFTDPC
jgi:inorganic pyrophosphatase